jgi:hypothetical protein
MSNRGKRLLSIAISLMILALIYWRIPFQISWPFCGTLTSVGCWSGSVWWYPSP